MKNNHYLLAAFIVIGLFSSIQGVLYEKFKDSSFRPVFLYCLFAGLMLMAGILIVGGILFLIKKIRRIGNKNV